MNPKKLIATGIILVLFFLPGCSTKWSQDNVFQATLTDIRLGDGVPLNLTIAIRWKIDDSKKFKAQFAEPQHYADQILQSKAREIAGKIANTYPSVDSVFISQREKFVQEIKTTLLNNLGEKGVAIKEVIFSDIIFPATFTSAMERVAMKERELQAIRGQSLVDIEQAKADEKKAEAESRAQITRAQAEGRVAEIAAKTEEKKRAQELARAETEARVAERKSAADAERQKLLNQAEIEKQTALKNLEIQKVKDMDDLAWAKEKEVAQLCISNPAYATFLVNKELASKVQIAVLPVGTEAGVLGNLLEGTLLNPKAEGKSAAK